MLNTSRKYHKILKVRIAGTPLPEVLRQVREKVLRKNKFLIVTPNPEQIIQAQNDEVFLNILNQAEISVPDAIGLVASVKFLSLPSPKSLILRIPTLIFQGISIGCSILFNQKFLETDLKVIKGRVLFMELIKLANKKGWRIVLLGDDKGSAQKAVKSLKANYKKVNLYAFSGPRLTKDAIPTDVSQKETERAIIDEINQLKPQLLIIGFGAPKQEKWFNKWRNELNCIGTMVVGGTFNYIAGTSKLPPKFFEKIGLEWLWRILSGSQRLGRVFRATVIFPLKVFLYKLYRQD